MNRSILFIILILIPISTILQAQEEDSNALDFIPPSQFVSGWIAESDEILARPEDAGWLVGEDAWLLEEYECKWIASENYTRGDDQMSVEIYEFPSASDAFGFYSVSYIEPPDPEEIEVSAPYHSPPPAEIETIRQVTYDETQYLEAYKDRFYFRVIVSEDEFYQAGIRAALAVLSTLPGTAIPADMVSILPGDDLIRGTERYIRGPVGLSRVMGETGYDLFDFNTWDIKIAAGEYRAGESDFYFAVYAKFDESDGAETTALEMQDFFQDTDWETVMVGPLSCGIHPRVFQDEIYTAFWPNGESLVLLWDITDGEALSAALEEHGE